MKYILPLNNDQKEQFYHFLITISAKYYFQFNTQQCLLFGKNIIETRPF